MDKNKPIVKLKTLGDNVDDLIMSVAKTLHAPTEEAVEFIIWRVYKFLEEQSHDTTK